MLYVLRKHAPRFLFSKATAPKFPPLPRLGVTDKAIMEALLFAVRRVGNATRFDVMRALERGDVEAAVDVLRWDEGEAFLRSVLPQQFRSAFEIAGERATRDLQRAGMRASFDLINQRAVEFVRNHSAALIREFNQSSQAGVRTIIRRAFEDGIPVRQTARLIMEDGIGLTERDARALMNLRRRLERDTELDLSDSQLNARIDRKAEQLLRGRAENIARTETIRAEREGTQESWRQAADEGLLDVRALGQEWIATPDERECDVCMDLDGQKQRLGESFQVSGETFAGPPAHPNCRCTLGITQMEDA